MDNQEIIEYETMARKFLKDKVPLEECHPNFFVYFLLKKYNKNFKQKLNTSDINEQKEIISGYSLYLLDFKKKLSEVANLLSINPNEYSDFYHTVVADPTIFVPVNRLSQAQINKVNNMMETTNVVTSTDVLKQLKLNPKMLNYPVTTELKFSIDD